MPSKVYQVAMASLALGVQSPWRAASLYLPQAAAHKLRGSNATSIENQFCRSRYGDGHKCHTTTWTNLGILFSMEQ